MTSTGQLYHSIVVVVIVVVVAVVVIVVVTLCFIYMVALLISVQTGRWNHIEDLDEFFIRISFWNFSPIHLKCPVNNTSLQRLHDVVMV